MKKNNSEKTPSWKKDFPIDFGEATHVSRREFAKFLGLFSGALALGNAAIVIKSLAFPEKELEGQHFICQASEVPVGEMKQFEITGKEVIPYILIHLEEGEWRAFEQKCTHLACAVRYRADINQIECPCHKGYFDPKTGRVLQGPPPRPLPQLDVVIKEDQVFVQAKPKKTKKS
ncbi:Rieske (2Fe-2S) protein [Echinicola jeungdonensis]|uniref:Ubiquinol-cytochrome c reductase iron-sulfur subunit n=1 Tax=Echinicola jeungdonensis TaxID=709343 RepID=A0ABV5J6Z3_9BACT|nr:Rieske (2Fe-2S) protein [Echinicola jeungdonensis]MDN3670760.1 Rieske (2Fe-2S) protein [Echinicola jeungdonensis]